MASQKLQWHPKNYIHKADPDSLRLIGTAGDAVWVNGEWRVTSQDPNGGLKEEKGYWSAVHVREGDTWKIRLDTFNVTSRSPAAASPTASPSSQ
jgi:ketosteroid isomerase-like protein